MVSSSQINRGQNLSIPQTTGAINTKNYVNIFVLQSLQAYFSSVKSIWITWRKKMTNTIWRKRLTQELECLYLPRKRWANDLLLKNDQKMQFLYARITSTIWKMERKLFLTIAFTGIFRHWSKMNAWNQVH